jgi:cell division protein FtsI (penicillin-binding protein 3)
LTAVDRRTGLLFALFLALLVVAVMRATWLGTVRGDDLSSRAVAQQVELIDVPARRGAITDRNGTELAVSEDSTTVYANPRLIADPSGIAEKLAPFLKVPEEELTDLLSDRSKGFVYLARKLPLKQGRLVEKLEITGIATTAEPRRVYPQGTLAGQMLGSVGVDNYGLSGIEQSLEDRLHGTDGKRKIVNDALGEPISIVDEKRARPGEDVRLTIDAKIQQRTESVLAGVGETFQPKGATALVLDPRNGEVLALANYPSVDPGSPGEGDVYARQNRAVQASYEPGSTFKPVTISGALEERLVTPETTFDLPPQIQVADRTIGESHDRGYVSLTVSQILAQSSNVGSVKIGLRLGADRFDEWIRRFGFGEPTGIDLPGEASGILLDPDDYSGSSMGNMPIGQGLAVTPIQMAAAYQAIANHGVVETPHVVAGTEAESHRVISAETADQVTRMLEGVLGPGGTAEEASVEGYTLAGKTGTAEKPDPVNGGYSEGKYFASFIGFAPASDPRLLVAVMVDEPQGQIYGGQVAAPAFEKIVSFALPYLRIAPE